MNLGGLQLKPEYKDRLSQRFIVYYLQKYTNERMGYIHWTASYRDKNFPSYHVMVLENRLSRRTYATYNAPVDVDKTSHTYQRNTNSFSACIASMQGGNTNDLGRHAPTRFQLARLIEELAKSCMKLKVPVGNLMTHAEAADNIDGATGLEYYGPKNGAERWDFHCWINPNNLQLYSAFKPNPGNFPYFGDWLRGEVILLIQKYSQGSY